MILVQPIQRGNPPSFGGELGFRWLFKPTVGFDAFVGGEFGRRGEFSGYVDHVAVRTGLGFVAEIHASIVDISLGGGVTVAYLQQGVTYFQSLDDEEPNPGTERTAAIWAPGGYLHAALHIPLGPVVGLDFGVRGLLYRTVFDDQPTGTGLIQGHAGLAFRFGGRRLARAGRKETKR